jgi:ribosome biogenesis GTPase
MSKRRKGPREKNLTSRYLSGNLDEDRVDPSQRFSARSKQAEQDKILRTTLMRAEDEAADGQPVELLPIGQVLQVHSLFSVVEHESTNYLCVVRKTLARISDSAIVVGDRVRFRAVMVEAELPIPDVKPDAPQGVIEQVLPRQTVLTRADSFKAIEQHPIVANAQQMLIVVALAEPRPKWGLVDRMIVAAQAGGLTPIVCLNKVDMKVDPTESEAALAHYGNALRLPTLRTSVVASIGLDLLRDALRDRVTVLAGHSGVGKSSLINAVQPQLDLRTGQVSRYTEKGRHTTTSAVSYRLDFGGSVIDTPGVKLFGLWGVTPDTLPDYFPDIAAGNAPPWRQASYTRIARSLVSE